MISRIGQLLGTVSIMALALFVPAGTLEWGAAWCYLAAYLVVLVLAAGLLLPGHRDVIEERGRGTRDAVRWDVLITRALTVLTIGFLVVSGLDHRLGWTPSWPGWVTGLGFAVFVAGYGLVVWAMRVNRFFSQAVRIQGERDHVTVTAGPYVIVRHPGYLGMVLNALGGVLILGTRWGWVYLGCVRRFDRDSDCLRGPAVAGRPAGLPGVPAADEIQTAPGYLVMAGERMWPNRRARVVNGYGMRQNSGGFS